MSTALDSWIPRHRLTVDEYYRMAEVGLLAHDARVELIEGEIIDMVPIGSPHGAAVDKLTRLLSRMVGDSAIVGVQRAVRLNRQSEPQPDLVLLVPRDDFYASQQPSGADTLLIIEVSGTSLRFDREVKVPLYARHHVPEVWIVDLEARAVIFYRAPVGGIYTDISSTVRLGPTALVALPNVSVDLSTLFAGW